MRRSDPREQHIERRDNLVALVTDRATRNPKLAFSHGQEILGD
jgi:hypothetical protein